MDINLTPVSAIKQEPGIEQEPGIKLVSDIKLVPDIKQVPDVKQEPDIKQEPNIKQELTEPDNVTSFKPENREILVEIGMSRKKVCILNGSNSLLDEFNKHVCLDPALSDLVIHSYPVFQTFNMKFGTWVDIDCEGNLSDGAVVKVMFFPKVIETDRSTSGSIKRKRDDVDNERNPKQRRIQYDNMENVDPRMRSDLWSPDSRKYETSRYVSPNKRSDLRCSGSRKYETSRYVYSSKRSDLRSSGSRKYETSRYESPKKRSDLRSSGTRKYETVRNVTPRSRSDLWSPSSRKHKSPIRYPSSAAVHEGPIRKNLLPYFHSDSRGSVRDQDTPSPMRERKQWFLMPEEDNTNACNTPTCVWPLNFQETKPALLQPDFHLQLVPSSSYIVGQTVEAVLPDTQIRDVATPPMPLMRERRPEERNINQHVSAPPVPLMKEERLEARNMDQQVMTPSVQRLWIAENLHAHTPQKYASESKISDRQIHWDFISRAMRPKRLSWGCQNLEKIWWNTLFSGVALFGLEGNRIRYFDRFELSRKNTEIFWGFRSFDGPNIIVPLGFSLAAFTFAQMLRNKVVKCVKDHYKNCDITLQYLVSLKTQFDSRSVRDVLTKNSIWMSEWPYCAKDLSPVDHAWRLVAEKVKNIPCSSAQEMLSIVSGVWEKDLDVQLMCSNVITLLPQIIKSVVDREGNCPKVIVKYVVTTSKKF